MPRAIGAFRKTGFYTFAFPIHLRTGGWSETWKPDSTGAENLRKLDLAVYEWLGLAYYKLKGYSDEWFPEPANGPNTIHPISLLAFTVQINSNRRAHPSSKRIYRLSTRSELTTSKHSFSKLVHPKTGAGRPFSGPFSLADNLNPFSPYAVSTQRPSRRSFSTSLKLWPVFYVGRPFFLFHLSTPRICGLAKARRPAVVIPSPAGIRP